MKKELVWQRKFQADTLSGAIVINNDQNIKLKRSTIRLVQASFCSTNDRFIAFHFYTRRSSLLVLSTSEALQSNEWNHLFVGRTLYYVQYFNPSIRLNSFLLDSILKIFLSFNIF